MQIRKIKIQNFRLLKDFSIYLEENLSLIIGKNLIVFYHKPSDAVLNKVKE